jgi:uncharacterized membrane protein
MFHFLGSLNPHLAVFIATLIPVLESQASIPLGLLAYKLPLEIILVLSTVASACIPLLVMPVLNTLVGLLRRHPRLRIWVDGFLESRIHKHSDSFNRWGSLALIIYIAIPGPFTGAWTATLLAYIFGIKYWSAILAIAVGSLAAGLIVAAITLGGLHLFA